MLLIKSVMTPKMTSSSPIRNGRNQMLKKTIHIIRKEGIFILGW